MSFDSLLVHELVIRRQAPSGGVDGWGQPVSAAVTVATVPGLVQQRSADEVALVSQAGAVIGQHRAFLRPLEGLGTDCWVEVAGERYDVLAIADAGGRGHHLELDLRRVS